MTKDRRTEEWKEVKAWFGVELDEEKFVDMVTVNDVLEGVCRAGKSARPGKVRAGKSAGRADS